jgi:small subunit ribosomal protein S13
LSQLGFCDGVQLARIKEKEKDAISALIETNVNLIIKDDLKNEINKNIKKLKKIKAYKGFRHKLKLPVRGQRTKTNAKTRKKIKLKKK